MVRPLVRLALATASSLLLPVAVQAAARDAAHAHDDAHDDAHDHAHEHGHDHGSHREHGAHVHGVAWLDIALDGATLEVQLKGTGADIAGLEGAPADAADVAKVDAARRALTDVAGLFAFEPVGACRADGPAEVEPPASALVPPGSAPEGGGHGDWSASWRFACTTPPTAVTLALFDRFPELSEVRAQVLGPGGQSAAEATPAQRRIAL